MQSTPPADLAAVLADRYRIERQIGQGGMATVYLAHDLKLERQVALKVLRPELGAVLGTDRFLAEVKITARLDHPHILTLIDSGSAGGRLYYVLPYVRGESLRDLLDREQQLSIEQALAITRHVGSALDYAHRMGVVHRDIKPENILLQEGEAMLADFGIAIAVQESGGGRLTETGLSLGTPHYMSPEQATAERAVDARSDQYSLAAVLYEMLVGEPPITGKTAQAVIAKLLTESPMHVRTVRDTVPDQVDAAIAKALSKVPADRFANVAEFLRATDVTHLTPHTTGSAVAARAPRRSRALMAAGAAAVIVVGAGAVLAAMGKFTKADTSATLRDRTQLTFTGNVTAPTLSEDGKQLAYFTKSCDGAECRYAIELQDVGSTITRRILEGATAAYGISWSPDRRNLLMFGTIGGRYGTFIISALGGPPRYLTPGAAAFYGGGDSLLLGPGGGADSSFNVRVATLDGTVRDSLRIPGPGTLLASLGAIPGSRRIVAMILQPPRGLWQIVERNGTVTDRVVNSCTCGGAASRDAIWMTRAGPTAAEAVVRIAFDSASGKFARHQDTIYSGRFASLSVTNDGTQMAVDEGSYSFSVVAASVADLIAGKLPAGGPLMQASNLVNAFVSPDGARLLMRRTVPGPGGQNQAQYSVRAFEGGAESSLNLAGTVVSVSWSDSVTLLARTHTASGSRLSRVDIRTGAATATLDLPDSVIVSATSMTDGWAWIPKERDRIIVDRGGRRHEIATDSWFGGINSVEASPDGTRLLYTGWARSTDDTLRVDAVPVSGGTPVSWSRSFAESGYATWLADGSIAFLVWPSANAVTLHKVSAPGRSAALGTVGHVASFVTVSRDLRRATLMWRDYRGDAWMHRVVKRAGR